MVGVSVWGSLTDTLSLRKDTLGGVSGLTGSERPVAGRQADGGLPEIEPATKVALTS
jgi:hypothetical protein